MSFAFKERLTSNATERYTDAKIHLRDMSHSRLSFKFQLPLFRANIALFGLYQYHFTESGMIYVLCLETYTCHSCTRNPQTTQPITLRSGNKPWRPTFIPSMRDSGMALRILAHKT